MRKLLFLLAFMTACQKEEQVPLTPQPVKVEEPSKEELLMAELLKEELYLNEDTRKAYYTISTLLKKDNVAVEATATQCHILRVASHIGELSKVYSFNPVRLITIGFHESRFGVAEYLKGNFPISSSGDCGIYQQQPQFAILESARKCENFKGVGMATEQAIMFVKQNIIKRFKAYSTSALDKRICHYNSGNVCNGTAKYVAEHKKTRLKAQKLYDKVPADFKLPDRPCGGVIYAQGN